jgi:predicted nucleic acid-binding protein
MIHEEDDLILIGDLILLELLQGARDDTHAARIERDLRCFTIISMLNENLATEAARYYRRLRALGATVRKTADMIIGTFRMVGGHSLLHDDRDFEPMALHLGLRVLSVT